MKKKIELCEDDFKKVVLLLSLSKQHVTIDPKDLLLGNLWRVAPKLAEKFLRQNGYEISNSKGRITVKPIIVEKEEPPTLPETLPKCRKRTK